jgi:hypothetical protein
LLVLVLMGMQLFLTRKKHQVHRLARRLAICQE